MRSRLKTIAFAASLIFFTSLAAAQISQGGSLFTGADLGGSLIQFLDSITIVTIASSQAAALFFAVFLVFYFAEINIIEQVFLRLEERIRDALGRDTHYRMHGRSDSEYPTGTKGLALAIAFITANGIAGFLGLMGAILMGLIGLAIVLLMHGGILSTIPGANWLSRGDSDSGPGVSVTGGNNNGGNPGRGAQGGSQGGSGNQWLQTAENILSSENLGDNLRGAGAAARDVLEASRGEEQEDDEVEQEIQQVIKESQTVERHLNNLLQQEKSLEEFKSHLKQLVESDRLSEEEAREINIIINQTEDVAQLENKIQKFIENVLRQEEQLVRMEDVVAHAEEQIAEVELDIVGKEQNIGAEFQDIVRKMENVQQEINQIAAQEQRGEIDAQRFDELRRQKIEQIKNIKAELGDLINKIREAANEVEEAKRETQQAMSEVKEQKKGAEGLKGEIDKLQKGTEEERQDIDKEEDEILALPEGDRPPALEGAVEEEDEIEREEEEEETALAKVGSQELEVYKQENDTVHKEQEALQAEETALKAYEGAAQNLNKALQREMEELEEIEERERYTAQEIDEKLRPILKRVNHLAEALGTWGTINEPTEQVLREVNEYEDVLNELEEHTSDEKHLKRIYRSKKFIKDINNILAEEQKEEAQVNQQVKAIMSANEPTVQKVNQILDTLIQDAQNAQNEWQATAVWTDFQKLYNNSILGDRSGIPDQRADEISQKERELMDILKRKGVKGDMPT